MTRSADSYKVTHTLSVLMLSSADPCQRNTTNPKVANADTRHLPSATLNRPHIPYRNSMMTTCLKDSLGGNCRTVMVATASSDQRQLDESISTCRFAVRVAMVSNKVCRRTQGASLWRRGMRWWGGMVGGGGEGAVVARVQMNEFFSMCETCCCCGRHDVQQHTFTHRAWRWKGSWLRLLMMVSMMSLSSTCPHPLFGTGSLTMLTVTLLYGVRMLPLIHPPTIPRGWPHTFLRL